VIASNARTTVRYLNVAAKSGKAEGECAEKVP
jgi:hypothetical protein